MATYKRRTRSRGRVEQLPSGSLRAVVYAGTDPLTGRRHFLREVIPAGPKAADEAEKAVRRLAAQVDERKHPRTNATLDQLLDRYLETLDVAESTRKMYAKYCTKHVRPFVGRLKAGAVDVEPWTRCTRSCAAAASTATAPEAWSTTGRRGRTSATRDAARTAATACRRRRSGTSTSSSAARTRRVCAGAG
jgi:hypothetical protein